MPLRLVRLTNECGNKIDMNADLLMEILAGKNAKGQDGTYVLLSGYAKARWVYEQPESVRMAFEKALK